MTHFKESYFLDLSEHLFKALYKRDFSELVNLKYFYISNNALEFLENDDLSGNPITIRNLTRKKSIFSI